MTTPDWVSESYSQIHFSDREFREALVKMLNWLEEPAGGTYKKTDGTVGHLSYSNDFYVLHDTIHVEHDSEYDYYDISILMGEVPHA